MSREQFAIAAGDNHATITIIERPPMCGRFALYAARMTPEAFEARFGFPMPLIFRQPYSFNIPPYQDIPVIYQEKGAPPAMRDMLWQLIPAFSKTFDSTYNMFNSRDDSFLKKGFKQNLLRRSRCIIPANHFYEWEKRGSEKIPIKFEMADQSLFSLGGIYSIWQDPQGPVRYSCSIITVPPNKVVAPVHNRMPFILPQKWEKKWLDPSFTDIDALVDMMEPFPAAQMRAARVSSEVNSTRNDGPHLMEEIEESEK